MEQGLVFIKEKISTWKSKGQLKAQLLQALCSLAIEKPEHNKTGFTAIELVEGIQKIRAASWSQGDAPEAMSRKIRDIWKDTHQLWVEKSEGLRQELKLAHQITQTPELDKVEGGGTGNPSRYRILWLDQVNQAPEIDNFPNAYQQHGISYICEDVTNPGLIAKVFSNGVEIKGWRRILLAGVLSISLLMVLFVLLVFFGQVTFWEHFGTESVLRTLIQFVVIFIATWMTIGSFLELPAKKIVNAPWWMQSTDGDRLLEHRTPPRYLNKTIKAVTYTATCPICSGKVTAMFSRLEFMGRIVGRCENAPVEHVFSFDHYTRSGKHLR